MALATFGSLARRSVCGSACPRRGRALGRRHADAGTEDLRAREVALASLRYVVKSREAVAAITADAARIGAETEETYWSSRVAPSERARMGHLPVPTPAEGVAAGKKLPRKPRAWPPDVHARQE